MFNRLTLYEYASINFNALTYILEHVIQSNLEQLQCGMDQEEGMKEHRDRN